MMVDFTQRLPIELLEGILAHASVLDILRVKLVNRIFRDVIESSPLIQHKLALHSLGLKHNPAAGIELSESRKALFWYLDRYHQLKYIEERTVADVQIPDDVDGTYCAGGVYGIMNDSVRLFRLGSVSRGIPFEEWEIPCPQVAIENYAFCPGADVIAFAELPQVTMWIVVHLRSLSTGGHHPAARHPAILYSRTGVKATDIPLVSISGSRLAVLAGMQNGGMNLVIWDWRNAQTLFANESKHYHTAEFIDDCRLLVTLGPTKDGPPCLVLMEIGEGTGGTPVQTSFRLSPYFRDFGYLYPLLERGAYKPSPAESVAPFHQDPAQRIVALAMTYAECYLVFQAEALLRLAQDRKGSEIEWDEWKRIVLVPRTRGIDCVNVWVSGSQLLCVTSTTLTLRATEIELYDFSIRGRKDYLSERTNRDLGGVRYLKSTGIRAWYLWDVDGLLDSTSGHDSILFFRMPLGSTHSGTEEGKGALHVWRF